MAIKRLNYFDNQFLVEADFTEAQQYQVEMRRRLARLLATTGIAEGLEVAKSAARAVTVRPGTALDRDGRTIIIETNRVVDLSNAVQFPAGATVFLTLAYQEQLTDPSTATGAPGMTRVTELSVAQASTVAPPGDGTVIPLARFTMDAGGNVPGNINDLLDGGVRQTTSSRGERWPVSVDGVSNPGGNIDLVQAQSISILPDDSNNRITIGETHSARLDNPHATTASQIGAMLASDYDLRRRSLANVVFTSADATNATRTVTIGFQPRLVLVVGTCTANIGARTYGGGVSAFADLGTTLIQRCFGFGLTRFSNTDWFVRGFQGAGLFIGSFFNQEVVPAQAENLNVSVQAVLANGLTAVFTRGLVNAGTVQMPDFTITLNLLCFG